MPRQIAALPISISPRGRLEVFLVTSRGSGRWIIPKGNPIKGLSHAEVAAREAYEEAGLVGRIVSECVGSFAFDRLRSAGKPCLIDVYPLLVERQVKNWDERGERTVLRCQVEAALSLVCSPSLADLIRDYSQSFGSDLAAIA